MTHTTLSLAFAAAGNVADLSPAKEVKARKPRAPRKAKDAAPDATPPIIDKVAELNSAMLAWVDGMKKKDDADAKELAGKFRYADAMAAIFGMNWDLIATKKIDPPSDEEGRLELEKLYKAIGQERRILQERCTKRKISNINKRWQDAREAQAKRRADAALIAAGLDPNKAEKRQTLSYLEKALKILPPLYKSGNVEDASEKTLAINFHVGQALIAAGFDLTQANLATK